MPTSRLARAAEEGLRPKAEGVSEVARAAQAGYAEVDIWYNLLPAEGSAQWERYLCNELPRTAGRASHKDIRFRLSAFSAAQKRPCNIL